MGSAETVEFIEEGFSLETLFRNHGARIYRMADRMGARDAASITRDVFVKAHEGRRFCPRGHSLEWLLGLLVIEMQGPHKRSATRNSEVVRSALYQTLATSPLYEAAVFVAHDMEGLPVHVAASFLLGADPQRSTMAVQSARKAVFARISRERPEVGMAQVFASVLDDDASPAVLDRILDSVLILVQGNKVCIPSSAYRIDPSSVETCALSHQSSTW